jgi:hypothetical protein
MACGGGIVSGWSKWYRTNWGAYARHTIDAHPRTEALVFPPPADEPFLPCSANVWTWRVLHDGRMVAHGEAADRQDAARDAMAAARAHLASLDPSAPGG